VHDYGFYQVPTAPVALARPVKWFPGLVTGARAALDDKIHARSVPIAITEYNLFTLAKIDTGATMSQALNTLYIADYIGQMAQVGVTMANQWNLVNGTVGTEGDYGALNPTTSAPMPQYYGLALWQLFGDQMLPINTGFNPEETLSMYAGVRADGTLTLMVVNKASSPQSASIGLDGATSGYTAKADVVTAQSVTSTTVTYNGSDAQPSDLASVPAIDLGPVTGHTFTHTFEPLSVSMLLLTPTAPAG